MEIINTGLAHMLEVQEEEEARALAAEAHKEVTGEVILAFEAAGGIVFFIRSNQTAVVWRPNWCMLLFVYTSWQSPVVLYILFVVDSVRLGFR